MLVFLAFATALSLSSVADAARACANGTYAIRVGDVRYDSADQRTQFATVAAALSYNGGTPIYECNAQWPQSWAGWYEGGSNIVWADCIWTGAGAGSDTSIAFAVDWKTTTLYISHTFACSDKQGSNGFATGSLKLDMSCTATKDGSSSCIPTNSNSTSATARPVLRVDTKLAPAPLDAKAACTENSQRYQSWQLEKWVRKYEMEAESLIPGSATAPSTDTGPSFTLKNLASGDLFSCTTSGRTSGSFEGSCQSDSTTTTAKFLFDPKLDFLTISQRWTCGDSTSFDAIGVGYMQATCDRAGTVYTCTSDPVWIGTKIV